MFNISFQIPEKANDGATLLGVHRDIERFLARTYGGFSVAGPDHGVWIHDGVTYTDAMLSYRVQITPGHLAGFLRYIESLKSDRGAGQIAIWVRIDGEGAV